LTLFLDYWILLPLLALFLLGLLWNHKIEYKKSKIRALHDALLWMYQDLNFNTEDYSSADIRITLWSPISNDQKIESYRMVQILDYVPPLGKLDAPKGTGARKHKTAGRVFRFTRCPANQNDGDSFAFYRIWKQVDYRAAMADLADRAGIPTDFGDSPLRRNIPGFAIPRDFVENLARLRQPPPPLPLLTSVVLDRNQSALNPPSFKLSNLPTCNKITFKRLPPGPPAPRPSSTMPMSNSSTPPPAPPLATTSVKSAASTP